MRKLTAVFFVLFIAVSAVAAPNDSTDRSTRNPISRIVRQIKSFIRALEQPSVPVPGQ